MPEETHFFSTAPAPCGRHTAVNDRGQLAVGSGLPWSLRPADSFDCTARAGFQAWDPTVLAVEQSCSPCGVQEAESAEKGLETRCALQRTTPDDPGLAQGFPSVLLTCLRTPAHLLTLLHGVPGELP